MAIVIIKKFNGLKESIGESIAYQYLVVDAGDNPDGNDQDLREQIVQALPSLENNIKLTNISIDEQINNTTWLVTATYATDNKSFPNQSSMSFDTSGSTAHKSTDLLLLDSGVLKDGNFVIGEDWLKEGQQVGFNGEDVEGVDIVVPAFKFTETHPIPDSVITNKFRNNLFQLTGTVNKDPFRGFEAGEVLFTGVSGSKNGTEKWLLSFNFEALPNKRNFDVGGYNVVLKRGWEYIAVRYTKQLSDDKTRLVVKAVQVDVHKMYETKDFEDLGIGTDTWEEETQDHIGDREFLLFPSGQ